MLYFGLLSWTVMFKKSIKVIDVIKVRKQGMGAERKKSLFDFDIYWIAIGNHGRERYLNYCVHGSSPDLVYLRFHFLSIALSLRESFE